MMFVDGRISAVLDWEFAYNGEPLSDLGYLLYFFASDFHGPTRPTRLSGMWTRDQVIAAWEQASGRSAAGVAWHEAAQIARVSAMIVTAANQFASRPVRRRTFRIICRQGERKYCHRAKPCSKKSKRPDVITI